LIDPFLREECLREFVQPVPGLSVDFDVGECIGIRLHAFEKRVDLIRFRFDFGQFFGLGLYEGGAAWRAMSKACISLLQHQWLGHFGIELGVLRMLAEEADAGVPTEE